MKNFLKNHWLKILGIILFILIYPITIFFSYTVGYAFGQNKQADLIEGNIEHILNSQVPEEITSKQNVDFDPFWKAWYLLEERFVHSTATTTPQTLDQDKVWGAIRGLTAAYDDPYTVFLPPDDKELFDSDIQGEFTGVGIEIGIRNGVLTVISPLSGTPAANAGIRAKDIISQIDGVDSETISPNAAVKLIRGEKGTPVVLSVLREGESELLDIEIIRDVITIPTIESEIIDGVFVIKLFSFSAPSAELFRDELQKFANTKGDKLIIDLRGNPGGFLQAAVSMASWFLPEGEIIVTESFEDKREERPHTSLGYDVFTDDLKLVILTDTGSASASEILAGALRDHKKALLVGQNTFGKGSVQELIEITPDTSLKVTIAKWLLPLGDHIDENGITPDVEISQDIETTADEQLDRAIEILTSDEYQELSL